MLALRAAEAAGQRKRDEHWKIASYDKSSSFFSVSDIIARQVGA
jgi:hypothetical protein